MRGMARVAKTKRKKTGRARRKCDFSSFLGRDERMGDSFPSLISFV